MWVQFSSTFPNSLHVMIPSICSEIYHEGFVIDNLQELAQEEKASEFLQNLHIVNSLFIY